MRHDWRDGGLQSHGNVDDDSSTWPQGGLEIHARDRVVVFVERGERGKPVVSSGGIAAVVVVLQVGPRRHRIVVETWSGRGCRGWEGSRFAQFRMRLWV